VQDTERFIPSDSQMPAPMTIKTADNVNKTVRRGALTKDIIFTFYHDDRIWFFIGKIKDQAVDF
jgi:hypothetical protein